MRRSIAYLLFGLFLIIGLLTSVAVSPAAAADCGGLPCPPTPVPGPPSYNAGDPDGDGIPNGIDQCPEQGGPSSNAGCPPGTGPAALPDNPPPITLPILPLTGDCVLATRSDQGVNIRIQPSTSAKIVGVLNSQSIYPVNGQQEDADGVWDRIDDGWVARRVVRVGGDCDAVPDVTPHYSEVTALQLDTISCDVDDLIKAIEFARSGDTINLSPECIYTLTKPYKETYFGLPPSELR